MKLIVKSVRYALLFVKLVVKSVRYASLFVKLIVKSVRYTSLFVKLVVKSVRYTPLFVKLIELVLIKERKVRSMFLRKFKYSALRSHFVCVDM